MSGWDSLVGQMTTAFNAAAPEDSQVKSPWQGLIETYTPQSTPRQETGGAVTREWVVQGLVDRGMPEHVAQGYVMNFEDESRLDPGINEIAPLVKGSRGGFGLSQWTGPRRRALEAYAAKTGKPVSDPELQLDFLVMETQGPERAAHEAALQTSSAGEAASVIVNKFLRPHETHRKRRSAKYLKTSPSTSTPSSVTDYSKLWLTGD